MWSRSKRAIILSLAAILTGLIATGGVLLLRGAGPVVTTGYRDLSPQVSGSVEASAAESESPSPSPSPSPSKKPSPSPKPKPSRKPVPSVPAPPPLPVEPSGCVPHYEGTNVPREQVGTALDAAAARRFWPSTVNISLPPRLIKAVAEQESGWQSAIVSCVGAIGAMQVLPATGTWMNQRFGTGYNVREVTGNAMLGSAYLQWLMKYFGDAYFNSDYSLASATCSKDDTVPDHREFCLLNTILSAYNLGHGTVEKELDDADETIYLNHAYIENVRALMSRF